MKKETNKPVQPKPLKIKGLKKSKKVSQIGLRGVAL